MWIVFSSPRASPVSLRLNWGAYDLLIDFARIGLGLACVIREFSQQALEQGGLFQVELATPIPRRSIGICHLSSINLTPSARRFIDLILS